MVEIDILLTEHINDLFYTFIIWDDEEDEYRSFTLNENQLNLACKDVCLDMIDFLAEPETFINVLNWAEIKYLKFIYQ